MTQMPYAGRNVVDLSALRTPAPTASPTGGAADGTFVFDVDEANFQARVIDQSRTVPVILDLWATWCEPCKQLSPLLERLAATANGQWLLAKIDVDANQELAAALQVQSIPTVYAVLAGQLVPMFTGVLPEQGIRQYLDEVLALAAEQGVTGRAVDPAAAAAEEASEPVPADLEAALVAMDQGDFATATAALEKILTERPGDDYARRALAQSRLLGRLGGVDPDVAMAAATATPDDIEVQLVAADVELATDRVEESFARLTGLVQRQAGEDRDRVRLRLLELFDVLPADDERLARARRALASALF